MQGPAAPLSVVDLAGLETALPGALAEFSRSTAQLIQAQQYQAVSGGGASPLPALTGQASGSSAQMIASLLESFLGGDVSSVAGLTASNTGFLDGGALDMEAAAQYLTENRSRAELILVFDSERPQGFAAGIQTIYTGGETETAAKSQTGLQPGDTLELLCDYYSYDEDCLDSYHLGGPMAVTEDPLEISNVPLEGDLPAHRPVSAEPLDAGAPRRA